DADPDLSFLQRIRHQPVSQHRSAIDRHMAGIVTATKPGFYDGRRTADHPGHSHVHGVVVLRISRQGQTWRGISLMRTQSGTPAPSSVWKRLGWMAAIWAGSVLALGVVALLLRLVMNAAGMTA